MNFAKGHIFADFAQENANRKRPVSGFLCYAALPCSMAVQTAPLLLPGFWAAAVAFLP